ncbi:MAG: hypothetical protein AABX12_03005 [Nanoarchaeota archaeon]
MNTKFKRHQPVRLLATPNDDDIEPYADPPISIKSGMTGTINILLPNGRYHVRISDKKGDEIAYVAMDEEQLEAI